MIDIVWPIRFVEWYCFWEFDVILNPVARWLGPDGARGTSGPRIISIYILQICCIFSCENQDCVFDLKLIKKKKKKRHDSRDITMVWNHQRNELSLVSTFPALLLEASNGVASEHTGPSPLHVCHLLISTGSNSRRSLKITELAQKKSFTVAISYVFRILFHYVWHWEEQALHIFKQISDSLTRLVSHDLFDRKPSINGEGSAIMLYHSLGPFIFGDDLHTFSLQVGVVLMWPQVSMETVPFFISSGGFAWLNHGASLITKMGMTWTNWGRCWPARHCYFVGIVG